MNKDQIAQQIAELETLMYSADFWNDKERAQSVLRELEELKLKLEGGGKFDKGDAVLSIFTGAGGDDAEDFSRMLYEMYLAFIETKGWKTILLDKNENGNGGFRSIAIEVHGKNAYGTLKNESGVHRLVRMSPFNAKGKRNTSFSMVEVLPKFELAEFSIPETDLEMSFAKSGGKG
jgi:peptide chain release factor 2